MGQLYALVKCWGGILDGLRISPDLEALKKEALELAEDSNPEHDEIRIFEVTTDGQYCDTSLWSLDTPEDNPYHPDNPEEPECGGGCPDEHGVHTCCRECVNEECPARCGLMERYCETADKDEDPDNYCPDCGKPIGECDCDPNEVEPV